jgi:ATP-binding cassette subfamily F protein 3
VKLLSGGEKNKLALAQLTYLRPNLLILDEPTNHLDLDSREALGQMLREYEGTLLLISHDRYLLDQVTTHTIEISGGRVTFFDGPYGSFRAAQQAAPARTSRARTSPARTSRAAAVNIEKPELSVVASRQTPLETLLLERPAAVAMPPTMNAHQLSKERQRARGAVTAAEQKIAALEARLQAIEASLSAPAPADNVVSLSQEHGGVQSALNDAMTAWERSVAYAEAIA